MPGSYRENLGRICDDLGSNILVCCWSYNTLNGLIPASDYVDILGKQEEPMVHILLNNYVIFQDDNSPIHTARSVQSWFEEHEDALQYLPWPAQTPDLNIIEPLWLGLDSMVRIRFPPPSSLKLLEDVLHGE